MAGLNHKGLAEGADEADEYIGDIGGENIRNAALPTLPKDTPLQDGRYVVLEVRATAGQMNTYLVKDTQARLCPICRTEMSEAGQEFCSSCGADLSRAEPEYLRYVMQETPDEQAFAAEARLWQMNLEHPSILLPRAIFAEAPQGQLRHYRVRPELSLPLASSLPIPQELNRVLEWGITLAQALDYLHQRGVTLGQAGLEQIAIGGKRAYWINLSSARPGAPRHGAMSEEGEIPRVRMGVHPRTPVTLGMTEGDVARDVQALARALLHLLTGQMRGMGTSLTSEQEALEAQLPGPVAAAFSEALTSAEGLTAGVFATALESALQLVRRPASVNLVVGRRTDVGLERMLNEDSLLTLEVALVSRSVNAPLGLFAVADGMGGHEAGDTASRLAIQAVAQGFVRDLLPLAIADEGDKGDGYVPYIPYIRRGKPPQAIPQWVMNTVTAANQAVYDQRQAAGTDMGTTLVMALIVGDVATIANVGDSRAYLLNQDGIAQITTDHSLVERLVAAGRIAPQEAASHPQRNIIYRVIGDKPEVEADVYEQRLAPGEALLLSSDGLSGTLPDNKIWHLWRTAISPQEACDRLVKAANQAGGEDNITVVIVQAEDASAVMRHEDTTHETHEFRVDKGR